MWRTELDARMQRDAWKSAMLPIFSLLVALVRIAIEIYRLWRELRD